MKLLLKLVLIGGLIYGLFFALTYKPHFTAEEWKAISIEEASKRLDKYIEQESLNRKDFKGPYCRESDYNPRGRTHTCCYKSNTHNFCYYQGGLSSQGYRLLDIKCDSSICQWLKKQP